MADNIRTTTMVQNYKKSVDWIIKNYTDAGVSFPNGFQKDAIQNATGARGFNKFSNWKCDISYVENGHGKFIVVEDFGTVGLTGKNYSQNDIQRITNVEGKKLGAEERLARFSSAFNSGDNSTGAGLFGAGKSVYAVASEDYTYYFDSTRKDKDVPYVAGFNKAGTVPEMAYEGADAEEMIRSNTGLEPKKTTGTRIIITNPKKELVDSIFDGSLEDYIVESWWRIIDRFDNTSSISVNGEKVALPEKIKEAKKSFEFSGREKYLDGYFVKNFGFFLFDEESLWQDVSYYRKGMKIGEVDLHDIPERLRGKYWGYIEVDEEWENQLAEIENSIHFGVAKYMKRCNQYQNLKNYCNEKIRANLIEWGYIKDKEYEDKKMQEALNKIAENLQDIFDKLGFEDLGRGPSKSKYDVRWQGIEYPVEGSERVTTGDEIKFSFIINNRFLTDKTFEYRLYVVNQSSGRVVKQMELEKVKVVSGSRFKKDFCHRVNRENSDQFEENRIVLSVKTAGSKETRRELPFFYDIDRQDRSREFVSLVLHSCEFPREGSRRVNFGETLKNVSYRVENKRNHGLKFRLSVSVHDMGNGATKLRDIYTVSDSIEPFEEKVISLPRDIVFEEDYYGQYLDAGVLELRGRLIAEEDVGEFEKGDRITYYNYKLFLNQDEKNGKKDAFEVKGRDEPEKCERSWIEGRKIMINFAHPAYLKLADYGDLQLSYIEEQMMKQYVLLYLKSGKVDGFAYEGRPFSDLESQDAVDAVMHKIEDTYKRVLEEK